MLYIPLTDLELSKSATIYRVHSSGLLRRRLMDLGFSPGVTITPLFRSPLGDPTAYGVLGSVVALRREDAMQIEVKCPIREVSK